jgi:hypothetical protein
VSRSYAEVQLTALLADARMSLNNLEATEGLVLEFTDRHKPEGDTLRVMLGPTAPARLAAAIQRLHEVELALGLSTSRTAVARDTRDLIDQLEATQDAFAAFIAGVEAIVEDEGWLAILDPPTATNAFRPTFELLLDVATRLGGAQALLGNTAGSGPGR